MPKRSYINPDAVVAPPGNFSWVVQADKTLYLAGQVGIDKDGKTVDPKDAGAQARQALLNIDATLRELGGSLDNIVRTTTYVVGRENLPGVRAGRKAVMDEGLMTVVPANTLLVVSGLASEDWLVEIEATAVLD